MKMNGATLSRVAKSPMAHRRRHTIMAFEMITLDRASREPLYEQLYRQIREELESGSFESTRLPSSRAVAASLGISRITVNLALSKLLAEGYLRARARSGIFVANHLPATFLKAPATQSTTPPSTNGSSMVARRIAKMTDKRSSRATRCWNGRAATLEPSPRTPGRGRVSYRSLGAAANAGLSEKGENHLLRYGSPRGEIELRKAIAAYLCDFRGAHCHADQSSSSPVCSKPCWLALWR